MISLAGWVSPAPFGSILSSAVRDAAVSAEITWPPAASADRYFHRQLVQEQLSWLFTKLAQYMRQRAKCITLDNKHFVCYRTILLSLRNEFELGIYNLNYDDLAARSLPDLFTGFTAGSFDSRAVALRREWNFLYHLHGSVHYSLPCRPDRGMTWKEDLDDSFNDTAAFFPFPSSGFKPLSPTTLIAGGYKLDQLLADPYQSFYASMVRHIHEADSILISGYGFGDHHVNRSLRNRFTTVDRNLEGRPQIAILTKTDPKCSPTGKRHDRWARELKTTIDTSFLEYSPTQTIQTLLQNNDPETDAQQSSAIWHGGFLEAVKNIENVISWLNRS